MAKTTLQVELQTLAKAIAEVNLASGWFDTDRPFAADIALLHSEVTEAFEAFRERGEVTSSGDRLMYDKDCVGAELADVLIRLLDTCYRYGINLGAEAEAKVEYNRGRTYRHGNKVV